MGEFKIVENNDFKQLKIVFKEFRKCPVFCEVSADAKDISEFYKVKYNVNSDSSIDFDECNNYTVIIPVSNIESLNVKFESLGLSNFEKNSYFLDIIGIIEAKCSERYIRNESQLKHLINNKLCEVGFRYFIYGKLKAMLQTEIKNYFNEFVREVSCDRFSLRR